MKSGDKVILDLCGGTGSWSKPYVSAGYDVRLITLPIYDVRYYKPPPMVYGVLAAPPCTEFSIAGTRWWNKKPPELLELAITTVKACLKIIQDTAPIWWALENPVGRLQKCVPEIGHWKYTFQPYDYGDPWTKRTCIWGNHIIPAKIPAKPIGSYQGSGHSAHGKTLGIVDHPLMLLKEDELLLPSPSSHMFNKFYGRASRRAITSPGFACAFFEANR